LEELELVVVVVVTTTAARARLMFPGGFPDLVAQASKAWLLTLDETVRVGTKTPVVESKFVTGYV
jgi:hypothetical protein